nr:immunoglobulin heavy chain junction region [Mus musculus]
CSRSDGPMDYW